VSLRRHSSKRGLPAGARGGKTADQEGAAADLELDGAREPGLLEEGARDANAPRIPDPDDLRSHGVITT